MEHLTSGIRALSRAVLDDTRAEAERIVSAAYREADDQRRRVEQTVSEIRRQIEEETERRVALIKQQAIAVAQLEAQRILLRRREELVGAILAAVKDRLPLLRKSEGYRDLLCRLIVEAVEELGEPSECVVHVAPQDEAWLEALDLEGFAARWHGRVHLRCGEPLDIQAGVILETADGKKRYDNTLETRLEHEWPRLRPQVYRILFGER